MLSSVSKIFELVVKLAEKDPHFTILRITCKGTFQSFKTATIVLLDEVLAAFFNELGEAALVLPTKGVQKRLLIRLEFLPLLTLQKSLRNALVPVALKILLAHDLQAF